MARPYTPGHTPRPAPAALEAAALDPDDPAANRVFAEGLSRMAAGYYWEAHECFEAVWHASGRRTPVGHVLQGLVRVCAGAVKARQGQPAGVQSHGEGAAAHFRAAQQATGRAQLAGLDLEPWAAWAEQWAQHPPGAVSLDEPVFALPPIRVSRPS